LYRIKLICAVIAVAACCGLTACAAPGTMTSPAMAPAAPAPAQALENDQLQSIDARLQRLQDSVVMLEARLLDQQRMIDSLKQRVGQGNAGSPVIDEGAKSSQQSPTEIYLAAFGDYASGQYQKSISGFNRFLQLFPANDYASNARYWLAECYLALGQFGQAVANFDQVVNDYPKSSKAPDSMLKKAAALYQLNDNEGAMETIQLLRERYPKSSAAKNATENFN